MFHEFGHALHGMFSNVKLPALSGTQVPRDFVEYPVAVQRDVGARAVRGARTTRSHYQTGEPMPQELLDKVLAGAEVQPGLRHHRVPRRRRCWTRPGTRSAPAQAPAADDVPAFEAAALQAARPRLRAGAAALPHGLLLAHLRRRLLGRLLRLHLERGAGARHRRSGSTSTAG